MIRTDNTLRAGLAAAGTICLAAGVAAAAGERRGVVPASMYTGATPAMSHDAMSCGTACGPHGVTRAGYDLIESMALSVLTPDQRRLVMLGQTADQAAVALPRVIPEATGTEYDQVAHLISIEGWDRLSDQHKTMLVQMTQKGMENPGQIAMCFEPGTDPELVMAVDQALFGFNPIAFQQVSRWSTTATDGNTGGQGDNITLTYGFPPDGTFIPNDAGLGQGGNQLNAWLNGLYGSEAVWQGIFAEMFDRWAELIGTTYVFEPNDDGATVGSGNPGQLGVRADVRIVGFNYTNDGNGGVLAYNFFPNTGDMVWDAFDTFYDNTSQNSRRFRNVAWHEHGHGLGMAHVCPAIGEKLMEPFISTAYVGPQLDDILNGQRHYGDNLEPNNNPGTATPVGDGTSPVFFEFISIDDNSDTDVFELTTTEPRTLAVGTTFSLPADIIPGNSDGVPGPYDDREQTQSCAGGNSFNPTTVHDLAISVVRESDGAVIAVIDNTGDGQSEFGEIDLEQPGTYFISVTGDNTNNIQYYSLSISSTFLDIDALTVQIADAPDRLDPGTPESFGVTVNLNADSLVPGSARLFYRTANELVFSSTELTGSAPNLTATLPGFLCDDGPISFLVQAEGNDTGTVTFPANGFNDPLTAVIGAEAVAFADNFQTNQGWTVTSTADDGQWDRGVPVNAGRGDPPADSDGSGQCYLTDNSAANDGNSDVDDGTTTLTSPAFDLSNGGTISWDYWFNDIEGGPINGDSLRVETSPNGSTWTTVANYTSAASEWRSDSVTIDAADGSATFRVRFTASDLGTQNVVEAGVDAVAVTALECEDPIDECVADFNDDGSVNVLDVVDFINEWNAQGPGADFNNDDAINVLDVVDFINVWNLGCP